MTPDKDGRPEDHFFRHLMEHLTDSVYFKDRKSRFVAVNRQVARILGLDDPRKAIGRSDVDFFATEYAAKTLQDEQAILKTGASIVEREERETWPDGSVTWASITKMPLTDEAGRVVGIFGISRDISLRKLSEDAQARNEAKMRLRDAAFQREMKQAWEVLQTMLPQKAPEHPRLDVYLHYQPMEAIGGDLVAFPPVAGGSMAVFVGDLMGHGVAAALYLTLLKFLTDGLATQFGRDPQAYLEQLNRHVRQRMTGTFVTGLYGLFEFDEEGGRGARLSIAGAGHPYPLICRRGGAVEEFKLPGPALGVIRSYQTRADTIALEPGDRIFLYTDGLTETFNRHRKLLGLKRLIDLLQKRRRPDLRATIVDTLAGVEEFRGGAPVSDDTVLLGFEVR